MCKFVSMKCKYIYLVLLFMVIIFSCQNYSKKDATYPEGKGVVGIKNSNADLFIVTDFEGFQPFLNRLDDKIYVINFWATWCGPCIKELPFFEQLNKVYAKQNVEVILVSLDFPHVYEKKLKPFILEHQLTSKIMALNETDTRGWISKIDKNWSGSIPATLIYKNNTSKFFERSFTYKELEDEVQLFLK